MGRLRMIVLFGALAMAGAARAQEAIKIVVPFAAGGPVDAMARCWRARCRGRWA